MPASASAKRYASAAFSVATRDDDYDAWLTTLNELARIMQMPSARTIFASPAVPVPQKQHAIDRLLPNASPMVRNFLHILAARDALYEVPGIAEALHELIDRQRGIITAEVTTAIPLDAQLQQLVAQRLGAYLKRDPAKVVIRGRVDPAIIGGVLVRVGDQLIDDSIRGRLDRLRRTLASSPR